LHLTDEQIKQILGREGKGFIKARTQLNMLYVDSLYNNKTALLKRDVLLGINNTKLEYFDQLNDSLHKNKNKEVHLLVLRNGQEVKVPIKVTEKFSHGMDSIAGINLDAKFDNFYIKEVLNEENQKTLQEGDKIVSVTGQDTKLYSQFRDYLEANKGKKISLDVLRENKPLTVMAAVDAKGKLGVQFNQKKMNSDYEITNHLSFGQAASAAVKESWLLFVYNIKQFKLILKPTTEAYKQVKSPVGIARQLPDTWDWEFIWNFTALFSIGLAFMNLLPIPGLDGGHALFTIAEMITGRKLSNKAAEYVQTAGMIILLTLMALTFGKDIYQLIMDKLF
jgi:regulator of sigma E protease